jgi:hypothetical protein
MVDIVKMKQAGPVAGTTGLQSGFGMISGVRATPKAVDTSGDTNKSILKNLGIDLDTILTPKGKRKKKAGLVGGDPEELATNLGE